ncbi:FYVE and coiled-coil domain-containing protein 1-like [Penaeus monodon]|uniref:FYVE and coiled-coil domain-containing protein 1-like n=1 Tax=Penaeus monodon TaxID=6687 RepID=UPI0018A7599D|nr:FYVE and coiled-coil domain-containing protein 1-like [Penaeus monodon]
MVEDYEEMNLPINDDSEKLRRFCERLEFLLKFGLKERSLVLGGRKDLWPYLCRCLEERRNIQDGITLVKANKELKTNTAASQILPSILLVATLSGGRLATVRCGRGLDLAILRHRVAVVAAAFCE